MKSRTQTNIQNITLNTYLVKLKESKHETPTSEPQKTQTQNKMHKHNSKTIKQTKTKQRKVIPDLIGETKT